MALRWQKYALVVAGLVVAHYFLAAFTIERMPYTSPPSWWQEIWPSARFGLVAWFLMLNAAGAALAAVPVALIVVLSVARHQLRIAFAVAALTAIVAIVQISISGNWSFSRDTAKAGILWSNTVQLFLVLLLALPSLVWVARLLTSNKSLERTRDR